MVNRWPDENGVKVDGDEGDEDYDIGFDFSRSNSEEWIELISTGGMEVGKRCSYAALGIFYDHNQNIQLHVAKSFWQCIIWIMVRLDWHQSATNKKKASSLMVEIAPLIPSGNDFVSLVTMIGIALWRYWLDEVLNYKNTKKY